MSKEPEEHRAKLNKGEYLIHSSHIHVSVLKKLNESNAK